LIRQGKPSNIPTIAQLAHSSSFGRPSFRHSFTRTKTFFNIAIFIVKRLWRFDDDQPSSTSIPSLGYLNIDEIRNFRDAHPLINHLYRRWLHARQIDFSILREPRADFQLQKFIPQDRILQLTALAFHYDFHIPSIIRYLGGNYTKEYVNLDQLLSTLKLYHIPDDIIDDVRRIYQTGSPTFLFTTNPLKIQPNTPNTGIMLLANKTDHRS